jgi:predicted peptidase
MSTTLPRRTLLTTGAVGTALGAAGLLAETPAHADPGRRGRTRATFDLDAEVLDGGEQVVSVTIRSSRLATVRRSALGTDTFSVHVRATSPLDGALAYEQDRTVTSADWDGRDRIVLGLEHGEGVEGATTLLYTQSRNVRLDLEYTITQNEPLRVSGSRSAVAFDAFTQGDLLDPEVDAFTSHKVRRGLKYRLFTPSSRMGRGKGSRGRGKKRPLIVWLHGGGEGGLLTGGNHYYDNETTLRANRGALGFATDAAQRAFDGAYVVAPQSTSAWMDDGDGFAPKIQAVIDEVVSRGHVDEDRIHVVGCSNGGFMSLKMVAEHPRQFASQVPICSAVGEAGGTYYLSDRTLRRMRSTPTWLVAAETDTTLDPQQNTVRFHELIDGSIMSLYPTVTWDGYEFPGHWSWIYVAHDDPSHRGRHLWEWMAAQRR